MDTSTIREMMAAWNAIVARVRELFPSADDETVYQLARREMNRQVGAA